MDTPLKTSFTVTHSENEVRLEPEPVHGVKGFTLILTPDGARKLGHRLIGAATQAMPVTSKGGA